MVRDNEGVSVYTLRGPVGSFAVSELEVKHSRFVSKLVRVDSEAAARKVVEGVRTVHWNAGHHCSAFVLGSAVDPLQVRRCNDDGEPGGTAGRPMLDALIGNGLVDCVAVVSRYFGGTLLGAGGLIRAYSDAVTGAIDAARGEPGLVGRECRELFRIRLEHSEAGRVESELRNDGVVVVNAAYGDSVVLTLAVDSGAVAVLGARVAGLTSGTVGLEHAGSEWVDVDI